MAWSTSESEILSDIKMLEEREYLTEPKPPPDSTSFRMNLA
jgi:hypothetical protein